MRWSLSVDSVSDSRRGRYRVQSKNKKAASEPKWCKRQKTVVVVEETQPRNATENDMTRKDQKDQNRNVNIVQVNKEPFDRTDYRESLRGKTKRKREEEEL
ncbi:uncharacterized protein V6R79_022338 [Siganus canaliculatus]